MEPHRRYLNSKGPATAIILSLWAVDWDPLEPSMWRDAQGCRWSMTPGLPFVMQQLADALRKAVADKLFLQASGHPQGKGLELGGDFTPARKLAKYWRACVLG